MSWTSARRSAVGILRVSHRVRTAEHRPGWMKRGRWANHPISMMTLVHGSARLAHNRRNSLDQTSQEASNDPCSGLPVSRFAVDDAHLLFVGELVHAALPCDRRRVSPA